MNIFTILHNSNSFYARPDTSLNRENSEYYCPSGITRLDVSHFIFAKASKAGKCIASKFAERYYSKVGKGIQLTAPELIDSQQPQTWWLAHSLDSSTFTGQENDKESLSQNDIELINKAFETVSKYVSIRTGDYIAIETSKEEATSAISSIPFQDKDITIIW